MDISLDGWRFCGVVSGMYAPDHDWPKYLQKPIIEAVDIVFLDDVDVIRREMWAKKNDSPLRKNLFDSLDNGEVFRNLEVVDNGISVVAPNVMIKAITKVDDNWTLTFRLLGIADANENRFVTIGNSP